MRHNGRYDRFGHLAALALLLLLLTPTSGSYGAFALVVVAAVLGAFALASTLPRTRSNS